MTPPDGTPDRWDSMTERRRIEHEIRMFERHLAYTEANGGRCTGYCGMTSTQIRSLIETRRAELMEITEG